MKPVSIILGALIVACFALPLAFDAAVRDALNGLMGLHAEGFLHGRYWQALTYQFVHGGWAHIVINLLALFSVGPEIERVAGAWRMLVIYLGSGIVGGLAWLALAWPTDSILVGASAAICGLLGALAALSPREKFVLLLLPVPLPAWLLIAVLAATQVASILLGGGAGTIAYSAHLAGGIAGFAIAYALRPKENRPSSQLR